MLISRISGTGIDLGGVGGISLGSKALGLGAGRGLGGLGVYTDFLYLMGVDGAGDFCKFKRRALPMAAFLLMCIFMPISV